MNLPGDNRTYAPRQEAELATQDTLPAAKPLPTLKLIPERQYHIPAAHADQSGFMIGDARL